MLFYRTIFAVAVIPSLAIGLQNKTVKVKQRSSSVLGKYLQNHVFKTTKNAADPQHCLADCWEENDRCQSFNFLPELKICELNEASNITNPDDLIDRPNVVYFTNLFVGRQPKPQMARHTKNVDIDPCLSNPCTNADSCVKDAQIGYRCESCHYPYQGPRCEERVDPCSSNPCLNSGTCISTMTSWRCACPFPFISRSCEQVTRAYQFDLNGTGDHPYAAVPYRDYDKFVLNFLFKTTEPNTSYFVHYIPEKSSDNGRLSVWRVGKTFFVELYKGQIYTFLFPLSYPVNDNNWHVVTIVLHSDAHLDFYLDGVTRESRKLTGGTPGAKLYTLKAGTVHIGYFKDSSGEEYFFNGSIGNVDFWKNFVDYNFINVNIFRTCVTRHFRGEWEHKVWGGTAGMLRLARPVNCAKRIPMMGIFAKNFGHHMSVPLQWLEQPISPPQTLTKFTLFFQIRKDGLFSDPTQIACYGNQTDDCSLSVVARKNSTLEIILESKRFSVDLVPIHDIQIHVVIMRWTNDGGVFELIIDGVLQSSLTGIEAGGEISARSLFLVGGSNIEQKNLYFAVLDNFNVWDTVLSDEMLYMMTAQPGSDMGNFVAWKDFKRPASASTNPFFRVHDTNSFNFRYSPLFRNDMGLSFFAPYDGYSQCDGCGAHWRWPRTEMTVTMWLELKRFPATIFSLKSKINDITIMSLTVSSRGEIIFFFNGENASLGSIVTSDFANYLGVSWLNNGDLHRNLNGRYKKISSNFLPGFQYKVTENEFWLLGGRNNDSIVGRVYNLHVWREKSPAPAALMAMSRGVTGVNCYGGVDWNSFYLRAKGKNVQQFDGGFSYYLPDFIVQKKRDQYCNDVMVEDSPCPGKYRARIGMTAEGRKWGCFCEENLSEDMSFNYGDGDYEHNANLLGINDH